MKVGTKIFYTGDMANDEGHGVISKVWEANEYGPLRYDILMEDGREINSIWASHFQSGIGRRFWVAEEYFSERQAKLKQLGFI